MTFRSILFGGDEHASKTIDVAPDYFIDLNCDQIVAAVTAGKDEYNLAPFFYTCLPSVNAVEYRHAVLQDLEKAEILDYVRAFTQTMREMRHYMERVNKLYYKEQKEAWFLDAVEDYCRSVESFAQTLAQASLDSSGFSGFREYLVAYVASQSFQTLRSETAQLKADLSRVKYTVLLKGDRFTVRRFESEADYSVEVTEIFEKFAQGAVKDYKVQFKATEDMNHVEAAILEFVAKLYPDVFAALESFCNRNADFLDKTIAAFDREIQFYVSYLDYIAPLKQAGLPFCYPRLSDKSKAVHSLDGFDLALAHKLVGSNSTVVCNDFSLKDLERILVVSGPNQGGKTTFASTFGQMHYLANLGLPVPGKEAQLFLFDRIFTHFEREEKVETLRGKLEDDLIRVHRILESATWRSIIVMNEIFTSTTLKDEIFLSKKVMEKIIDLNALCVWVTFVDELASYGPQTVSMVSMVVPDNPAQRTFKILRRPADGLAYAVAIAQKYRVTYDLIEERLS